MDQQTAELIEREETQHEHHYHNYRGPFWMVIPDGHVLQKCCKCPATRAIHGDHA